MKHGHGLPLKLVVGWEELRLLANGALVRVSSLGGVRQAFTWGYAFVSGPHVGTLPHLCWGCHTLSSMFSAGDKVLNKSHV